MTSAESQQEGPMFLQSARIQARRTNLSSVPLLRVSLVATLAVSWLPAPARAELSGSAPRPLVAPSGYSLTELAQHDPATACGAGQCLTVWTDERGGWLSDESDVFGTIGTATYATVRDIPIAAGLGAEGDPAVDWDGTRFLVVYEDDHSGPALRGVWVELDGTVWPEGGFEVVAPGTLGSAAPRAPALAYQAGVHGLAFRADDGTFGHIHGAVLADDGTLLAPPVKLDDTGVRVPTTATSQWTRRWPAEAAPS